MSSGRDEIDPDLSTAAFDGPHPACRAVSRPADDPLHLPSRGFAPHQRSCDTAFTSTPLDKLGKLPQSGRNRPIWSWGGSSTR